MSRIDEALRRTGGAGDPAVPVAADQDLFLPAWPVADSGGAREEPATNTVDKAGVPGVLQDRHQAPGALSFSSAWRERLASGPDGNPTLIEQYRRLAATLHHAKLSNGLRSVMVTSARPGDGKTLTAINLALVLAESYRSQVLLIDADLRRPSIPTVVDIGSGAGLSEALRSPTEQKLALVPVTSRLTILPAGQAIANSIEALTSPRMRQILDEAVTRFDWVILDAPPVGPATDARLLTQMVEGTLFVIHAGQTQYGDVSQALDALGREHILGVVLNGVEDAPGGDYYYYGADTAEKP